jgi:hypothetical protein
MALRYAVDTNVLLRLSDRLQAQNSLIVESMRRLGMLKAEFCYTSQNLGEFWNVSTRPVDRNGFGLSIPETTRRFEAVVQNMTFLNEVDTVLPTWIKLMRTTKCEGFKSTTHIWQRCSKRMA